MQRIGFLLLLLGGLLEASLVAAEPAPLVLLSTIAKSPPNTGIVLLLARNGGAKGRAVTVRGPDGSALWAAADDGSCNLRPIVPSAVLQVSEKAPDTLPICFATPSAGITVQLLATTADADSPLEGVSAPIQVAQPAWRAFWSNPILGTLLSAAVGFAFGLASSWFQTWYDVWKQTRLVRRDAQKFIAESLFPELRKNGEVLSEYLIASPEERKVKSSEKLAAPKITEALAADRLVNLSAYFTAISQPELTRILRDYDEDLTSFNRMADRLLRVDIAQRKTDEQAEVAKRLHDRLVGMKVA